MKRGRVNRSALRGSATVIVVFAVVLLSILCGAMVLQGLQSRSERRAAVQRHKALSNADAGVAHAITNLTFDDKIDANGEWIGTYDAPMGFSGGTYWALVEDNNDGTFTVTSTAVSGRETEVVEAVLGPVGGGIYDNALFAGNDSGDPLYDMGLGGLGGQADEIRGDVYSGGDVTFSGDASVTGTTRAGGVINGGTGNEGVSQPIPDIKAMDYANTADFMVADLFAGATNQWDGAGGSADQVPESNPAHFLRRNPSDRSTETGGTVKDDYFIEDPYETVRSDSGQDGSNAYEISLSGISGAAGPDSNQKVFYIDGNLWLHNKKSYSFKLAHNEPDGVQVTFVVSGNIYFSDNFFYQNNAKDGVAFIAIKDDKVADSGNVYFGDPVYGTLVEMNAFMYAENNFYDVNLDASGSAEVTVNGNMTAGNQVLIKRDYGTKHTKLSVNFDDRISVGDLQMPGLPGNSGAGPDRYVVNYWHRLSDQDPDPIVVPNP